MMPDKLIEILGYMPFLLIVRKLDRDHITFNWGRLLEAIIIALISGFFAGYVSLNRLEAKFDLVAEQVKVTQQHLFDHVNNDKTPRR